MKKIFIGLFFVFLNVCILRFNLTPNFVGYGLIFLGLAQVRECPSLRTTRTILTGAAIISAVLWVVEIIGYRVNIPIDNILQLLVCYRLVVWAEEIAPFVGWKGDKRLADFRMAWFAVLAGEIAAYILATFSVVMAIIWYLAYAAAIVYYTYTYYRLWKAAAPAYREGTGE